MIIFVDTIQPSLEQEEDATAVDTSMNISSRGRSVRDTVLAARMEEMDWNLSLIFPSIGATNVQKKSISETGLRFPNY